MATADRRHCQKQTGRFAVTITRSSTPFRAGVRCGLLPKLQFDLEPPSHQALERDDRRRLRTINCSSTRPMHDVHDDGRHAR
jgi:hypothetical protein